MIKKILTAIGLSIFLLLGYLLFWPLSIKPVSWEAPTNPGHTGQYVPNTKLANLDTLSIGDHHGPEDVDGRMEDGRMMIYTSTQSGDIIKIDPENNTNEVFANTGGVPLGLQFDANGNLIIVDAHLGLLSINNEGKVTLLTNEADGIPIVYADELDIAADGKIYFTDASTKYGAKQAGSTLKGSLLELMEHGSTGRVLVYDPADKTTRVVKNGLSFPNGIAMCPDDECVLVNETGTYSILRIWLKGDKIGSVDTIVENLPGFPDNLNRGQNGRYWLGLISPRSELLDTLSAKPFLRKIVQRLPAKFRPKATNYGFVIAIDMNGKVLAQYQDPAGGYPLTTGATELGDGWLYISSLAARSLGRKDISQEEF